MAAKTPKKPQKTGAKRKELSPERMLELERAFRAGLMPWRAMSDEFGVGMSWLKRTSEMLGWKRDLTTRIQQDAQRKDQEAIAREAEAIEAKNRPPDYKLTEREVTEHNVDLIASVTGAHRRMLERERKIVNKCLEALEKEGAEISPTALKQLVDATKVIISTEREVLRIGGEALADNPLGALVQRVMGTGFRPVKEHHHADD